MRLPIIIFTTIAVLSLCSCSLSKNSRGTGSYDDHDGVGEGNIPVAQPGGELSDVNFAFDSEVLDETAKAELQKNSTWLLDNPGEKVVVEGHCDERGTAEYNLALGDRRAQSVIEYLRNLGVAKEQLDSVSYGEELPLDPASNESAWAKNRRAHFSIKN